MPITQDLGDPNCMIMGNYGLLTVGNGVAEAFYFMHNLHQSCEIHINTMKITNNPLLSQRRRSGIPATKHKRFTLTHFISILEIAFPVQFAASTLALRFS